MSMHFRMILSLVAVGASLTAPRPAASQSVERNVERWAETVAAAAERLAARIERQANELADRIEWELTDKQSRHRRSRIRDDALGDEGRVLPSQAQRIDTTFAFSPGGTVDLTSVYGDIVVTGWDRKEARVKAWTDRGRLDYDFSSSRLTIEHNLQRERGSWRSRDTDMRYELSVPRGARLTLHTTSGDIEVRNTGGEVEANSTSGDVTLEDVAERVDVGTVSGDISLRRVKGNIEANAVSGSVEASDIAGDIKLESTSGDLTVTNARGRVVELSTTSGEVSYAGDVDASGRYEFHSHSGTIDVAIPAGTSARFSVETFSGEIDSDFPIVLQPGDRTSKRPRRFEFTIGSGGPRIIAESFSGDVEIRKR